MYLSKSISGGINKPNFFVSQPNIYKQEIDSEFIVYLSKDFNYYLDLHEYEKMKKKMEKIDDFQDKLKKIEKKLSEKNRKICVIGSQEEGLLIESFENDEIGFYQEDDILSKVLGIKDIVILKEEIFKDEISRRLPVIARNCLENGVSKNLWYEEVVPRESVFYTGIVNSQNTAKFEDFCRKLEDNLIQIGANATIGYGFTKFEEVK